MRRSYWIALFLVLGLCLIGAAGFAVLVNPDNPLTRLFRSRITETDSRIVIGPYPAESDLRLLKSNGVGTVITLLNPALPYERVLLDRERKSAEKLGLEFHNFPMSSILGQKFGADYEKSAEAAAQAARNARGKVYLHCYLGLHRVKAVADRVHVQGGETARYLKKEGERTDEARQLDRAQEAFDGGRYEETLNLVRQANSPDVRFRLLEGWARYRTHDIGAAHRAFQQVADADTSNTEARTGLGYCALQSSDLPGAEGLFASVLAQNPEDTAALQGMGLVLFRQGKRNEAASCFERVLRRNPGDSEASSMLARIRGDSKTAPGEETSASAVQPGRS